MTISVVPLTTFADNHDVENIKLTNNCFEITKVIPYTHSDAIPSRICYTDGVNAGYIYFVSKEIVGNTWHATFQGILCPYYGVPTHLAPESK